jgi:hypothetical protein
MDNDGYWTIENIFKILSTKNDNLTHFEFYFV